MGRISIVAVALVSLAIGFAVGTWRSGPNIQVGGTDLLGGKLYIETDDWSYGGSAETDWIGADNVWHGSGVPDCLEDGGPRRDTRFASVEVTIEGSTWRPIIWIDCRYDPDLH
jgi:hypothetical protein